MRHSVNQQGLPPLQQGLVPLERKQEMIESHNTDEQSRFPVVEFPAPNSVNQQGNVPLQQGPVPLKIKQEMINSHHNI